MGREKAAPSEKQDHECGWDATTDGAAALDPESEEGEDCREEG